MADEIRTRPATEEYRKNWEQVFRRSAVRKKKVRENEKLLRDLESKCNDAEMADTVTAITIRPSRTMRD
jgi:hypothetical protein